jgi:hypothetical protein
VKILKESFSHVSEQWAQSHEDHSAATVSTITKVPISPSFCLLPPFLNSAYQAAARIRKDVALLAAQAAELHATVNSARAMGISGGGGGGGKSVAEIVDMTKEIQALTKKVEKLKAKNKAQVLALESLRANAAKTIVHSFSRAPPRGTFAGLQGCGASGVGGVCSNAAVHA